MIVCAHKRCITLRICVAEDSFARDDNKLLNTKLRHGRS